ncbi:MAG: hypothetical protein IKN81_06760 [Oscillospiraceae bacterium]|nr:hypothetical protein [Oscillospiraceae bacterium]
MKRPIAAVLALCVFLLSGCAKQPDMPPSAPPSEVTAPAEPVPVIGSAPPSPEPDVTVYSIDGLEIPVPTDHLSLLAVETDLEAWSAHRTPLISFSELASVEAGQLDHPGEDWGDGLLCTLSRLDRIGFEEWASSDEPGTSIFARDGDHAYYLLTQPTDVRLYRGEQAPDSVSLAVWERLNAWAESLPAEIIARNGLTAYNAEELFDADYTYGGEHVELGYRIPGEPMDLVLLALSQPARQGEGGIWCVERVRYVYSDYDMTDTHLIFPAGLGVDQTAAAYYADMQADCDAGENPDLLTPLGAALRYARSAAWLFGEDVSASDFEWIESLG